MMDALKIFLTTFFAIVKILAVCFGGYVMARNNLLNKQLTKDFGKVIFTIMIPCMIFGNIINSVDVRKAQMVGFLFLFPIVTHLIAFTLGQILRCILRYKSEDEEYLLVVAGSTFGNHGNISVPLVAAILGDERGPFTAIPGAKETGQAYVMVYMSMTSCILWGVGMPWFRRRNTDKLEKEKLNSLPSHEKIINQSNTAEEKQRLLQVDETELPRKKRSWFLSTFAKLRQTYIYELLTLPPVFALTTSLIIALIPPVRDLMQNTYASVIPDIATFVGDASIPIILMTLGANLAEKSNDSRVPRKITFSVLVTRLCTSHYCSPSRSPSLSLSLSLALPLALPLLVFTYLLFEVILPTCGIGIVYSLMKLHVLPDDTILLFLIMIQFSMPSAVNLVLACQVAGGGEAKMSSLLFWQYCVCSITISCFCIIAQLILL